MEKHWSIDEVRSLNNKIIIVTGSNTGVGFECAKAFAIKGATVIMACRTVIKGEQAKNKILDINSKAKIEVMKLNLGDLSSIQNFANNFKEKYSRLDILLNNAGMIAPLYGETIDGFEQQMGTNYVGPFALTGLLFDVLKQTPKSRVVNISSLGHKVGSPDFENLVFKFKYSPMKIYCSSKLANLFFTYELNRRVKQANLNMKVIGAHPGAVRSNLSKGYNPLFDFLFQDPNQGALPGLRASLDKNAKGGMFFGPDGLIQSKGQPILRKSTRLAHDKKIAKLYFERTEQITGIEYNFDKV